MEARKKDQFEQHPNFPSGEWTGFYTYSQGPGVDKEPMAFLLEFKDGIILGSGSDPVGPFSWRGTYDIEQMTCRIIKSYLGKHEVFYEGHVDENGIWGMWKILWNSGGFHIWPKGHEAGEALKAKSVQLKEITLPMV